VTQSSGVAELDKAAAECAATWHYKPAMENGKPIAVSFTVRIPWHVR